MGVLERKEWTYIGDQGLSVRDYVIANDRVGGEVKVVEEGNRTESDHISLEVELVGSQLNKKKVKKKEIEIERSD